MHSQLLSGQVAHHEHHKAETCPTTLRATGQAV